MGNCTVLTVLLLPFLRYRRIGASIIFQLFQVNVTGCSTAEVQYSAATAYFKKLF